MEIRLQFLILIIMKDPLTELPDLPNEELHGLSFSKLKRA